MSLSLNCIDAISHQKCSKLFKNDILHSSSNVELNGKRGSDVGGVYADAYTAFWKIFTLRFDGESVI